MRIDGLHLTYCSDIHPANGWDNVFRNLRELAPALKRRLSPNSPFGLGLRLSADESRQLLNGENLPEFQDFLADENLYVFTLNGFAHGDFHGVPLKEGVFSPDWRDPARVQYTTRLIEILRRLLPRDTEGSVSTAPLSYRAWVDPEDNATWERMALNIIKVAARLIEIKIAEDKRIHLDLEPEPDALLATSGDVVNFFKRFLLPLGVPWLARRMGLTRGGAESRLLDLLRVCLDTCHLAVEFEEPSNALKTLSDAGIKIGKLQLSAALSVPLSAGNRLLQQKELAAFVDEDSHLHQTVARHNGGEIARYRDLSAALPAFAEVPAGELRSHFHMPLSADNFGALGSTRDSTQAVLAALRSQRFARHLEIETYAWHMLPKGSRSDLTDSIVREYEWVQRALHQTRRAVAGDA